MSRGHQEGDAQEMPRLKGDAMGGAVKKVVLQEQPPEHRDSAAENRPVSGVGAQWNRIPLQTEPAERAVELT